MRDGVIALVVGLVSGRGSGLVGTLLILRHERWTELRRRMLEAADDFVGAYTAAREAIAAAKLEVSAQDSFADQQISEATLKEWRECRTSPCPARFKNRHAVLHLAIP